jgi:methylase of polypeptide subunit release factors
MRTIEVAKSVDADTALTELLARLKAAGYAFTTVSPATHARVVARPMQGPPTLRDIFGWSRPFREEHLDTGLLRLLEDADALRSGPDGLRSAYRVSSLGDDLFLHSAFPTDAPDSVFFGPDTYRFARFIRERLPSLPGCSHVVDMGSGSGAGGIEAARQAGNIDLTLVDLNPAALRIARINARFAGLEPNLLEHDRVPEGGDLVLANPPYMIDKAERAYRDGGDLLGGRVALDWAEQALGALRPGGAMLLYTGAAVVDGHIPLLDALETACRPMAASIRAEEIDPDVFGEELEEEAYSCVERIAVLGITIQLA